MLAYLVRRLSQAVVLLLLVSILFFVLLHAMPGGPEAVLFSPRVPESARQALRHAYGLDKPIPIQYLLWLRNVVTGNFGYSFSDGQPVLQDIGAALPRSIELFLAAMSMALIFALALGVYSAVHKYSPMDYMVTILAYFGISMPIFFTGLIMQKVFGDTLHWLPVSGHDTCYIIGCQTLLDQLENFGVHLIMPATVLSFVFIASWSRYLRASMIEVLNQDYVRTARSKGLSERRVYFRHALPNALIPFITQVAIDFGLIASGAVITETVFAWGGMGYLFYNSLTARDYPVLQAMLLIFTLSVIVFNLVGDILYTIIDPRIRLG